MDARGKVTNRKTKKRWKEPVKEALSRRGLPNIGRLREAEEFKDRAIWRNILVPVTETSSPISYQVSQYSPAPREWCKVTMHLTRQGRLVSRPYSAAALGLHTCSS
ncbi:hypothetical protein O3P69_005743 [Scylla paramamosain]|uniref:Uncharacterized protein n=1 Tax=Scylla paramamosain TaxID=85552 RepID=A0AAW0UAI4_SCYPA